MGISLFFSIFYCLVMFYESYTLSHMAIEIVIYYVYIDLIQSSSFNRWIKINLTQMNFEFKNVVQILKVFTYV
jgi:ABC-type bacteriocin/lantibiotic exporter with double-glycine peptidase domain